nr:ROK family protein [Pyrinomonadaceae bacterium]
VVDNDANTGALGEICYGAARGARNIVYLTVSTGIGGGIVIDGEIYHGSHSFAGECGHMTLVPDGPLCSCGKRGCLEALCSGTAIARQAALAVGTGTNSRSVNVLLEMAGGKPENITAKLVFEAARAGDELALSLVDKVCDYLGLAVANLINLFDPEMVVIGGGVAKAGRLLFDPLNHEIEKHVMAFHANRVKCVPAALGDDSVLLGAVALANKYCLNNRRHEQRSER